MTGPRPSLFAEAVVVAAVLAWLAGTVLARGFWSTTAAVFIPPYAWYLTVERAMGEGAAGRKPPVSPTGCMKLLTQRQSAPRWADEQTASWGT
jgi:hypothetical protein